MKAQSDQPVLKLHKGETSDFLAKLVTKPGLILLVLAIATLVQMVRYGPTLRYWALLAGSLFAGFCFFSYGLIFIFDAGRKRPSFIYALILFGGFVPYLFGIYLFAYEGLWRIWSLFSSFSVYNLFLAVMFSIGGYVVVNGIYLVSQFGRAVNDGKIIIDAKPKHLRGVR